MEGIDVQSKLIMALFMCSFLFLRAPSLGEASTPAGRIKAGLVFGGQYGEGLVLRRDPATKKWYGPSFATVAGASWGLQIGAQSIALVLVITNDRGLDGFKGNNGKRGGARAVAAGPVGRRGELGTDYRLRASIYSYSMTKGLFAGLSLEGAAITVDRNANQVYWGSPVTAAQALNKNASGPRSNPACRN
jgi:lipid-binding SYLF domain-containing protein